MSRAALWAKHASAGRTSTPYFTGGSVVEANGFRTHTFNTSSTLTMVRPGKVQYLVVAGGGGGGGARDSVNARDGGGGGAGGLRIGNLVITSTQSITVGSGGAGGIFGSGTNANGMDGGGSSIGTLLSTTGGGGGGSPKGLPAKNGGSGGGGAGLSGATANGTGIEGQGFDGGTGNNIGGGGGGGGGAGGLGANATASASGGGGPGVASAISGSSEVYASGGPGGNPVVGTDGLGNGGGGNENTAENGANGGSGIVIISYPLYPGLVSSAVASESKTYYASASGGGSEATGTQGDPWSLTYASSASHTILPGDTLSVATGSYKNVTISLNGVHVIADSGANITAEHEGITWELHDAPTSTYRTVQNTFSGEQYGDIEISGEWFPLATHKDLTDLMSSTDLYNSTTPYYLGPGIVEDPVGGRIYIRLTTPSSESQTARSIVSPPSTDPSSNNIKIYKNTSRALTVGASNCTIEGFTLRHAYSAVEPFADNITFKNLAIYSGYFGTRLNNKKNITYDNCTFDGELDHDRWWVAYQDVKGGRLVADHNRKCAIDASGDNILIQNCTFKDWFDGMLGFASNVEISGCLMEGLWDDHWQMGRATKHLNIHHNTFLGAGPSHNDSGGSTDEPGTIYIHHNIFDVTTAVSNVWWRRGGDADPGYDQAIAISSHGAGGVHPWKFYHNTFVVDSNTHSPYIDVGRWGDVPPSTAKHEVLNNIFVMQVPSTRDISTNTNSERWNGNCYFKSGGYSGSIWRIFDTSTGQISTGSAIQSISGARSSQVGTDMPDFEANGIEADPQLDANYKPQNTTLHSGSVDLTSTGWPGTGSYEAWRGAIAP